MTAALWLLLLPRVHAAEGDAPLVLPEVKGKLTGMAFRVPTPTVSIVDFTAELKTKTTTEELRSVLRDAAKKRLKGIMACEEEPLVSMDFKGDVHSSIVDIEFTQVLRGNMAKVVAWYDNEWGYSCRVADLAHYMGGKGLG